jgi:hypothetical protein
MKYTCLVCKYSGDDSGNWFRHINSKKHLKNVEHEENEEKLKKEKDIAKLKNKKLPENDPKMTRKLPMSYPIITHETIDSLLSDFDENESESNKSNNFNCRYCDKKFKFKSGLSRHINHRCPKINTLDESKDNKLIEIIKQQNELINELKNDKEYLKNTTSDAICAVKYSSVALKFVTENYSNVPLLKTMPDYLAIKKDCGERDLARVYCEFYRESGFA